MAVSRPVIKRIIDACEAEGSDSAQYRTTGTALLFPEDWVPTECLACFGQVQESFAASLVRVKRQSTCQWLCSSRESTFFFAVRAWKLTCEAELS
jgi:hypothetical protein